MSAELKIDQTKAGDYPLLKVSGEIDEYTYTKFREAMLKCIGSPGASIIVSLTDVEYIDSSGLGAMVAGLKRVSENQGRICVVTDKPNILRIFDITGLKNVFPLYANVAEAQEALESGQAISAVQQ